jgi:DNA helicase IV
MAVSDFLPAPGLLTKAQRQAMASTMRESLLVTGPPGSGKTVVALYRVQKLRKYRHRKVDLFVYSKVLYSYLKYSLKELKIISGEEEVKTFHKWIWSWYGRTYGGKPPQVEKFVYDWRAIRKKFVDAGKTEPEFDQLVIDEGQDIPVKFFKYAKVLSESLTVFADDNQAVYERNSTIEEIYKALERFNPETVELEKNHRNSREIAKFAALFVVRGIKTGTTTLPSRTTGRLPELCRGSDSDYIDRICKYSQQYPNQTIGIFLSTKKEVEKWYKMIHEKNESVQRYYYTADDSLPPPDFTKKGIIIVTFQSSKGLEFDAVYVPRVDGLENEVPVKMNLYVAFSRPRELLSIHHEDPLPRIHIIEQNIPDETYMKRVELGEKTFLDF